jgi:hypothetical protein
MDHRAIDVDGDIVKPTRLTHLGHSAQYFADGNRVRSD